MLGSAAPPFALVRPLTAVADFNSRHASFPTCAPTEPAYTSSLGACPRDLVGTLYRVGPGRFLGPWQHPVDGDGIVTKFTFTGSGQIQFQAQFVNTIGLQEELKAGHTTQRGSCGTPFGAKPGPVRTSGAYTQNIPILGLLVGDQTALTFKNTANTHCLVWNNELWAFWEGGFPYILDKDTLATKGRVAFETILSQNHAFTAHPKIEIHPSGKRTLVGFALDYAAMAQGKMVVSVVELDEHQPLSSARVTHHKLPGHKGLLFHDFSITPTHAVFIASPVSLSLFKLFLGYAQQDFLQPVTGLTKVYMLPRRPTHPKYTFELNDATHCYHHVGAVERNGALILDAVCFPRLWPLSPQTMPDDMLKFPEGRGKIERFALNLESNTVSRMRVWGGRLEDPGACEMPTAARTCDVMPYNTVFFADQTPLRNDGIQVEPLTRVVRLSGMANAQYDAKVWQAPERCYIAEPIFAPRMGAHDAEDGYVLVPMQDMNRMVGGLAILHAKSLELHSLHWSNVWCGQTYHGSWAGGATAKL